LKGALSTAFQQVVSKQAGKKKSAAKKKA